MGLLLALVYAAIGQVVPGNLRVLTDQHAFVVAHISSVSHVVLVGTSGGSVPISTVAHVTSTLHVQVSGSGTPTSSLSVRCVNTAGTAFVDCGGGTGSGDAVNVFHQSTVRHISSVTHISAAGTPWNFNMALSVRCVNTGATAFESCAGTSTLDAIAHVSGALHIAGTIRGAAFHIQGLGTPGASHGGVLTVQGIAGGNPIVVNVQHISGAVHLASNVTDNANNAIRVTGVTFFSIQGAVSHNSGQLHITAFHSSGALRAWTVSTCGTSASLAVATNRARRDLILQNIGTRPIFIGYGTTGHVALTTSNGFMLHAGEGTGGSAAQMPSALGRLELRDYSGPIACISTDATQTMNVLEILKN